MAIPHEEDDIVIAADTIVVLGNQVLGKPKDASHAQAMLRALSGRDHQVMTGVTVLKGNTCLTHTEITDIHFRDLSDSEVRSYVASGEPMDKAGAYGIQGGAALFADSMRGDYYNVMGLPVCRLFLMLREIAPEIMEDAQ
jgi:septum formation protein